MYKLDNLKLELEKNGLDLVVSDNNLKIKVNNTIIEVDCSNETKLFLNDGFINSELITSEDPTSDVLHLINLYKN